MACRRALLPAIVIYMAVPIRIKNCHTVPVGRSGCLTQAVQLLLHGLQVLGTQHIEATDGSESFQGRSHRVQFDDIMARETDDVRTAIGSGDEQPLSFEAADCLAHWTTANTESRADLGLNDARPRFKIAFQNGMVSGMIGLIMQRTTG